jgi:NAD(P)-dependent dehydrogenase (short-subunit alcohol dehydrogenase family)
VIMIDQPVIIVTGASKGLGAAIALWLGKAKTNVVAAARSYENLQKRVEEIENSGGKAMAIQIDVADHRSCRELISKTLGRFGRIDAIVNNAATATPLTYIKNAHEKDWKYCFDVNLMGPFQISKYSIPELRENHGRIINVSSGAANHPIESASAYCASKAALNQLTAVLAAEEPDITAIAVRPGVIDTDMQTYLRKEGTNVMPHGTSTYYKEIYIRGELESPEIPARSIAWLALFAPKSMSGEYRSYDDYDISGPAREYFGA